MSTGNYEYFYTIRFILLMFHKASKNFMLFVEWFKLFSKIPVLTDTFIIDPYFKVS